MHWAMWVCGLTGLAALPVAFIVIRHAETPKAVTSLPQPAVAVEGAARTWRAVQE